MPPLPPRLHSAALTTAKTLLDTCPAPIETEICRRLPVELLAVVDAFSEHYGRR